MVEQLICNQSVMSSSLFTSYKNETVLYLKKQKITTINNKVKIIVDKLPKEVGIDPYNKLIDTSSDDNRLQL